MITLTPEHIAREISKYKKHARMHVGFDGFDALDDFDGLDGFDGFDGFEGFDGFDGFDGCDDTYGFDGFLLPPDAATSQCCTKCGKLVHKKVPLTRKLSPHDPCC